MKQNDELKKRLEFVKEYGGHTKEEYEEAMEEMECWIAMTHIKKCRKCRNKIFMKYFDF
jgi:hypothetical protein